MSMKSALKSMARPFSVIAEIFEGRDLDRQREIDERAATAMKQVDKEPLRSIEERLQIDEYTYPSHHSGFAVHERNRRPRSRSEELERYERAERSLEKRLESVSGTPKP